MNANEGHDPAPSRPRARELGVRIGTLPTGRLNAITDVPGVRVGHTTLIHGDGELQPGIGPVRTDVTVILPHEGNLFLDKVPAAIHVLNGFGKCLGQEQVDELGCIESPIALTGTLNVGLVADALVAHAIRENPEIAITTSSFNPVVGECSDQYLNDMQGRHVREADVLAAVDGATHGAVAEGTVGAGTGMSLFGYKGGIGTSSRIVVSKAGTWTVGLLVLANFGRPEQLVVDGVSVGRMLAQTVEAPERGSIMIVVATDAPLLDRGLRRLARRAPLGLARTGSISGHGSGDYVIAFSNARSVRVPHDVAPGNAVLPLGVLAENSQTMDPLFQAVVEATEEAILNALFRATTLRGRDGNIRFAAPLDVITQALRAAGRLGGAEYP
jgi:D-aminopeptidase